MRIQETRPGDQTQEENRCDRAGEICYRLPRKPRHQEVSTPLLATVLNSVRRRPAWMQGAGPAWERHAEYISAAARLFFAASALLAIYIDPTEPSRYAHLAYLLLVAYVVFSAVVFAVVRKRSRFTSTFVFAVVAVDVAWATTISLFTQGPNSPFFLFFFFVLLTVAYRWGMRRTLVAAAAFIAIIIAQAFIVRGLAPELMDVWEPNRMIMRGAYLLILALVMGYLAEMERQLRGDDFAVSRLVQHARVGAAFGSTVAALAADLLRWFGARRLLLVTYNDANHQSFLWEIAAGDSPRAWAELPSEELALYLLPIAGNALALEASGSRASALNLAGDPVPAPACAPSLERLRCAHFLSVAFGLSGPWQARMFLLDPAREAGGTRGLRFLLRVAQQLGPAVHNVYLSRAMRAQASASERARIARELHDGVIQELAAISMEVEAARRDAGSAPLSQELERIRGLLADAVAHVRELMQQFRPIDIAPEQLPEFIADAVERFQRDTGIAASFVSDVQAVDVPRWVCRELARIVQEALVNVRRHSGARHVVLTMAVSEGQLRIVVDDDGKGFDFSGHLPLSELDARRKGPIVIKERARAIGAELHVTSDPERGARLELRYPLARRAATHA